jgi:hypothetical protein
MKKKPEPTEEHHTTNGVKTPRPKSKPILDSAIDAAKRILSPKSAAKAAEPGIEVNASTVVRRTYTKKKKTEAEPEVPPILMEGDAPPAMAVSGPGEKFSLGATPPAQSFSGGELPESYGTKKLFLTARDPHWLYAHWDLTRPQQLELNSASTDGHLVLRIFAGKIEGHPAYEIHVHPESRHWFAHVERAGISYAAELGYYSALGKWTRVALSSGTVTPPDAVSREDEAEFATIPFEFPFTRLMQIIEEAVHENISLAQAIEELRRAGHPDLPRFTAASLATTAPRPASIWTPQQEQALAKVINIDQTRRIWMGSLEITELIRLSQDVSSPVNAFGISSFGISSPTSPFGGEAITSEKNFWFNVNAELIIYGATEPGAKVTLGGHEIKLRSDGTFSYRFALPDGHYNLPAVAVSSEGDDARAADLKFSRTTKYLGDVGTHPQDPSLKPPRPESI